MGEARAAEDTAPVRELLVEEHFALEELGHIPDVHVREEELRAVLDEALQHVLTGEVQDVEGILHTQLRRIRVDVPKCTHVSAQAGKKQHLRVLPRQFYLEAQRFA